MIKVCRKHGETEFSGARPRCKKCRVEFVARRRKVIKRRAVEHKGGKCERCGYSKCMEALDFHHRDQSQKEFGIGKGDTVRWSKVLEELDKCLLLCANCHRELHYEDTSG